MKHLALKVRHFDGVGIDNADAPNACGREIQRDRRSKTASANEQHTRLLEPALSIHPDLREAGGAWDKNVSDRLREHILANGNTIDRAEAYRRFRGRDPEVSALLEDRGFEESKKSEAGSKK